MKAFRKTISAESPDKKQENGSPNFVSQADIQTNISGRVRIDNDSHGDIHEDMQSETVDCSEK